LFSSSRSRSVSSTARWILLPIVGGPSSRTTPTESVRNADRVGAVGDPVEILLDAPDVVALLGQGGAERRPRDWRVVR